MTTRSKTDAAALTANKLGALWTTLEEAMDPVLVKLSPSSTALLIWLYHWAPKGVVELARVVRLSQPACTRAVASLVKQGLVRKTIISGKQIELHLTARGRLAAERMQLGRQQACASLLNTLTRTEREQLDQLLDKLLRAPVTDREYAMHVCRFCDHALCDGPACPIGCRATELEREADVTS